jgi:hypothetical protein
MEIIAIDIQRNNGEYNPYPSRIKQLMPKLLDTKCVTELSLLLLFCYFWLSNHKLNISRAHNFLASDESQVAARQAALPPSLFSSLTAAINCLALGSH